MPSNNGISFSATGRVRIVDAANATLPFSWLGALAFDVSESLITLVDASAPKSVSSGWPFEVVAMKIVITDAQVPNSAVLGSLTHIGSTLQAVAVTLNNPIASWSEGLPFDQFGNLCVVYAGVLPANRAYSSGFSLGYS